MKSHLTLSAKEKVLLFINTLKEIIVTTKDNEELNGFIINAFTETQHSLKWVLLNLPDAATLECPWPHRSPLSQAASCFQSSPSHCAPLSELKTLTWGLGCLLLAKVGFARERMSLLVCLLLLFWCVCLHIHVHSVCGGGCRK